jgi:hypothetical protein
MAIDGFPVAISQVIEQPGYLERKFREGLRGRLGYRAAATKEPIEAGNGETVIKTRPQMLSPKVTPINPANNTGLDNGLTASNRGFEQYQITLNTYADTLNLSLEQSETLISSLFIDNAEKLGEGAAQTLDSLCAQYLHQAYDSGDTFALTAAASGATSLHVDNRIGFDTNFNTALAPSLGLPIPVSGSNTVPFLVLDGTTGNFKGSGTVSAFTDDGTNVSSSNVGGIAYGVSSILTVANLTTAVAVGDRIVAMDRTSSLTTFSPLFKDGAYVVRPNGKGTRYSLSASDTLTLPLFATAKAKLSSRGVKPFKQTGCYVAVVDDLLLAQLYTDQAFQIATQGTFEMNPVFKNGVISRMLGVEFVSSTSVPVFQGGTPGSGLNARHAIVMGEGALIEGPFVGTERAARQSAQMGISNFKMIDNILMITRPGIDRFGDIIAQTYKYTGGFSVPTDKGTTPAVIPLTDYSRWKRAVAIEVGSVI